MTEQGFRSQLQTFVMSAWNVIKEAACSRKRNIKVILFQKILILIPTQAQSAWTKKQKKPKQKKKKKNDCNAVIRTTSFVVVLYKKMTK